MVRAVARVVFFLVLAGASDAGAQSSQTCPWLNAGTAAKVLGAEVDVTAHADSNWSGSCRFVTANAPLQSIEIEVGKSESHPCGDNATPLEAIGNQAFFCLNRAADGTVAQIVAGRVRDARFVLKLVVLPLDRRSLPLLKGGSDSSAIEFLAEQIAGNLY